jgi:ribosomal protein S18 acetylase RimI-like enzyme
MENMISTISIASADFANSAHTHAIQTLVNALAACDQGRHHAMQSDELEGLISGLQHFPNKEVFLAEKDNIFCGVVICFYQFATFSGKNMLKVHDLYVAPAFRSQGVGTRLIQHCVAHAREHDCAFVTLEVALDNPAAIGLYQRLGFVDWLSPTKYLELSL